MVVSSGEPYLEERFENVIVREFPQELEQSNLVWHQDKKDRRIEILEGEGWKFQYDNNLPFELKEGDEFAVEAYEYHRLIKGNTKLVLRITENG